MTRIRDFGQAEADAHNARVRGAVSTPTPPAPKASKYHNEPTVVGGIRFASKKEARQDAKLLLRLQHGQIRDLKRQVPFPLVVNGVEIAEYIADWTYYEGDAFVVHDAKGRKTDVYKLKKRLMKALFSVEIRET